MGTNHLEIVPILTKTNVHILFRKAELPWFAIVSPYFKVNSRDYSNNKLSWLPHNSHKLNFIVWHIIYPLMIFKVVVITVIMIIWQEKKSSAQFSWKYGELGSGCGLDVSKDASLMLRSNRNFNTPPPPGKLRVFDCFLHPGSGQRQRHKSMIWFVELRKIIVLHVGHPFCCQKNRKEKIIVLHVRHPFWCSFPT